MRNLLIFISKYNAFFLFLIFEIFALAIYIQYNSFQKATYINTTNQVTGTLYAQVNQVKNYLSLRDINDSLARENARLHNQLRSSYYIDSTVKGSILDTIYKQQYNYIEAKVINNTVNHRNNYITINRGSKDGIAKDMGVISSSGVVGMVVATSEHFALIRSLLHKDTRISAMLINSREIGSLGWGDDMDPRKGLLVDVPNHVKAKVGEMVVTSGYSLWPTGIAIGKISNLHAKGGGFFLNMEVALAVDFSKLEYVYIVNNKFALEQAGLEAQKKKDD
ncbi:rod shape-determining protein MreC [Mucilaginibacter lacusdianchii]|uniref:rod shape-determining protein MreC n=1 Tax=Mucilaginibacter lacusdianchii TaxID=2684211 RepID=UPI00131C5378|nr:rod shape-determining protein MreC [Mucilaginibacter sp. JXJ CY 39]